MNITTQFTINNLEFSHILSEKYTWNKLKSNDFLFKDNWRVPKRYELLLLYDECPKSHSNILLWTSTSDVDNGYYAWYVDMYNSYTYLAQSDPYNLLRLVRIIK
jgi:hypothetical protein